MSDPALEFTFNENLKSAYSHGLENIYLQFESINVKSIRPLSAAKEEAAKEKPKEAIQTEPEIDQLEFDFGDAFRGWIDPFILSEPIQVL